MLLHLRMNFITKNSIYTLDSTGWTSPYSEFIQPSGWRAFSQMAVFLTIFIFIDHLICVLSFLPLFLGTLNVQFFYIRCYFSDFLKSDLTTKTTCSSVLCDVLWLEIKNWCKCKKLFSALRYNILSLCKWVLFKISLLTKSVITCIPQHENYSLLYRSTQWQQWCGSSQKRVQNVNF